MRFVNWYLRNILRKLIDVAKRHGGSRGISAPYTAPANAAYASASAMACAKKPFGKKIFPSLAWDRKGVVGIEMAIVGPPFLLLLVTIIDLGLMLTTQSLLDGAARDASRLIRTGQVQNQGSPIGTFQTLLCNDMSSLMSVSTCQTNVIFKVQVFATFGSVAFTPCTQNANQAGPGTPCTFTPGTAGQIVAVQATYQRPFIVPWVSACLTGGSCWIGIGTTNGSNAGTGTATLTSTVIFRNEPFI
jgi:Flp pilus assembly protein TadG